MEATVVYVAPAMAAETRSPAHRSRTHRLLGPHKQAKGWNVLALSNGRWKLPDDRFTAFLEHYVSDLPRYNLGLVVKKSAYFPYIMDVDKRERNFTSFPGQEQHEGRERGQPDGGAEGGRSGSEVGGLFPRWGRQRFALRRLRRP